MNISFDSVIEKVFDGFKKVTPALVVLAVVSGLILFLPDSVLSIIHLNNLNNSLLTCVGLVFLVSTALVVVILFALAYQGIRYNKLRKKK